MEGHLLDLYSRSDIRDHEREKKLFYFLVVIKTQHFLNGNDLTHYKTKHSLNTDTSVFYCQFCRE